MGVSVSNKKTDKNIIERVEYKTTSRIIGNFSGSSYHTAKIHWITDDHSLYIPTILIGASVENIKKKVSMLKEIIFNRLPMNKQITLLSCPLYNKNDYQKKVLSSCFPDSTAVYKEGLPIFFIDKDKPDIEFGSIGKGYAHMWNMFEILFVLHIYDPVIYHYIYTMRSPIVPIYRKHNKTNGYILNSLGIESISELVRKTNV